MKPITTIILLLTVFSVFAYAQKAEKEDYSQIIKEATPKELPQTPVVKRQSTDAQDESLKGKVRTVKKESEDLSGTWRVQGRHIFMITDFNEKGNRIKHLLYNSNAPLEISVYGYIEGKRVADSKIISSIRRGGDSAISTSSNREKIKTSDPRYSMSYEYKYTDGKLTEKKSISNDGTVWMTRVYNYKDNQMEEKVYDENGKLNQKYLSTFDEKGNEIERIEFDAFGNPNEIKNKYSIKYESFDKQGNWIKRTTSKQVTENGKPVYKPYSINYQTITYYP